MSDAEYLAVASRVLAGLLANTTMLNRTQLQGEEHGRVVADAFDIANEFERQAAGRINTRRALRRGR